MTQEASMHCYEVIMQASPFDRAVLLDAIRNANDVEATHALVGRLGDRLRADAFIACSRCRGHIGRDCVICGGNGSIRFLPNADEVLDRMAKTPASGVKGVGR
jgi:hypothetical protein